MPTILGTPYDCQYSGLPPHMSLEDRSIWDRWFPTIQPRIKTMYFDVGLGPGAPLDSPAPPNYARMWQRLTQLRADVVALVDQQLWIIELRYAANANAIGRLLSYRLQYLTHPILGPDPLLYLVTNERDSLTQQLCAELGITYLVV